MACRLVAGRCSRPPRAGIRATIPGSGSWRCKGLICWRQWPVEPWLFTAAAKDRVAGFLRTAAPLHQWLDQQVGPDLASKPEHADSRRQAVGADYAGRLSPRVGPEPAGRCAVRRKRAALATATLISSARRPAAVSGTVKVPRFGTLASWPATDALIRVHCSMPCEKHSRRGAGRSAAVTGPTSTRDSWMVHRRLPARTGSRQSPVAESQDGVTVGLDCAWARTGPASGG